MNEPISQTTDIFQAVLEERCFAIVLTVFRSLGSTVSKINAARDPQDTTGECLTIHLLPSCPSPTLTVVPSVA